MSDERSNGDAPESASADYGVAQITVLSQREHVRLRPAMYIGTVSEPRGLAQMAFEIIDNAVDEHEAGHGMEIDVHVAADFTVTVVDHGRGIPVGPHPTAKGPDGEPLNTLTVVLGTLNAGGKFRTGEDGEGYGTGTIGMHGVGSSVVQMLSDRFEATVRRDGGVWRQAFSRGLPTTPVERVGDLADPNDTGTTIVYHPDPEVFRQTLNPGERLPARLEEIASLNAGLRIHYVNDDAGVDEVFVHEDGLAGLVLRDLGERQRLHDQPFVIRGVYDGGPEQGRISVDAAFIYDDDPEPGSSIRTFANNVGTVEGGTHRAGLKAGLREVISARAQALKLTKTALETRYIEDGLHAAVSVKLRNPEMEGQTKTKLGNKVAATAVETVLRDGLAELARDQAWATALDAVAARAVRTREAEEAARRARSVARSTKAVAKAERLPSKLAECVWPVGSYRELVIVEGNSAAGCFTADTRVPLVDGRTVTMAQLVEEHAAGKVNHVYSVSPEGNLTAQPVLNAWETKRVSRLAEVTLDNGEVVRCTVDHLFMLRDGTYAPAETLTPGASLMPLYTRTSASSVVIEDEGDLYQWALNPRDGRWTSVAKLVAEQYMHPRPRTGVHIHHVDRNGLNNSPGNLVYMSAAEHLAMHNHERDASALIAAHRRRMREDPEYFERTWRRLHSPEAHAKIAKAKREYMANPANREHLAAKAHEEWADPELRAWRAETTRAQMAAQAQRTDYVEWTAKRTAASGASRHLNTERRVLAFADWLTAQGRLGVFADFNNADVRARFCMQTGAKSAPSTAVIYKCLHEAGPDVRSLSAWAEWRRTQSPPINHKVAGVRLVDLPEPVPVYDLEVPPYANFALAAGVFVHNSAKEGRFREFQAILPLRGKILNVSKADLERALSSETIRTLIVSIGTGIGREFSIKGLRYKKIIMMCLAGDTRVKLLNGTCPTLRELVSTNGGQTVWVYSLSEDGHVVPGKAFVPSGPTRREARVCEVELTNGHVLRCTVDHKILVRTSGGGFVYVEAANLQPGASLASVYTRVDRYKYGAGREEVLHPGPLEWQFTYHAVAKHPDTRVQGVEIAKKNGWRDVHVHHIDRDKTNNDPANLEVMSADAHRELHGMTDMAEYNRSPEHSEVVRNAWRNGAYKDATFASHYNGTEQQRAMLREMNRRPDVVAARHERMLRYNASQKNRDATADVNRRADVKLLQRRGKIITVCACLVRLGVDVRRYILEGIGSHLLTTNYSPASIAKSFDNVDELCALAAERAKTLDDETFKNCTDVEGAAERRRRSNILTKRGMIAKVVHQLLEQGFDVNEENYTATKGCRTPTWAKIGDYFDNLEEAIEAGKLYNHTVRMVRIVELDEPMDFFCLNVEGTHNFGVVVGEDTADLQTDLKNGRHRSSIVRGRSNGDMIIVHNSDADVDGAHIRSLLLTFLYYYMRPLIVGGYVYAAVPPLYRVIYGDGSSEYLEDDRALAVFRKKKSNKKYEISRFKGLGEMSPEQLRETTLDPSRRLLRRITIEDAAKAARSFDILMGKNAAPRWEFIVENALRAETMNI